MGAAVGFSSLLELCQQAHSVCVQTRAEATVIALTHLFSTANDWLPTCNLPGRRQMRDRVGDAMTSSRLSKMAVIASVAAALSMQAMGQRDAKPTAEAAVKRVIVVSLEDRRLALVEGGQVKRVYTVAVGKPSTPSPVGTFAIARRVKNPTYHHDGKTVLPGPGNPVGTRWMGLSIKGYGIHGTNEPKSIGKAASHGCIRMAKGDLEEFYEMVAAGDTVELVGQRNEETAELFGDGMKPGFGAMQTLLAAKTISTTVQKQTLTAESNSAATTDPASAAGVVVAGSL